MDRCVAVAPGTSPVRSQLRSARSVAATQADSAAGQRDRPSRRRVDSPGRAQDAGVRLELAAQLGRNRQRPLRLTWVLRDAGDREPRLRPAGLVAAMTPAAASTSAAPTATVRHLATAWPLTGGPRSAPASGRQVGADRDGGPPPAGAEAASSSLTVTNLYPASVMDPVSRSSCFMRLALGSDPPS